MNEQERATGEVAKALGLNEPQIQQVIRRNPHLAPPIQRGRRRWRWCDVQALAEYFGVHAEMNTQEATAR